MYAKLVVGATAINVHQAMRDIGRLITSETPSTALLGAFSQVNSVIVDDTPAGWTYVGSVSADDRPTIAAVGAAINYTIDTHWNLAFSAPCLEGEALKYMTLNVAWRGLTANNNRNFTMTGAESVTSLGVATNEGGRYFWGSAEGVTEPDAVSLQTTAGSIIHVIATPRHVTLINEGRGMQAIWETTMTDVHRFYGTAPFVHFSNASSVTGLAGAIIPTSQTTAAANSFHATVFAITDLTTSTLYGTYGPTVNDTLNQTYFRQQSSSLRRATISDTGAPRYQISPCFFQLGNFGYPTQYVTGVVPMYWTAPQIGTTGDTIDINGDSYTFFNSGTIFGVAMKTS
jgi:hypothetical protein